MSVIKTKLQSPTKTEVAPATEAKVEKATITMEDLLARVSKLEGNYDNGYGAPTDKTPKDSPRQEEEKAVPGVPGTAEAKSEEKKEGNYDDKYVAPMAEEKHDEPDGDECECSACKGSGKMKKAVYEEEEKKAKSAEEKMEAVDDEDEEEEEKVTPKKATAFDFGKACQVFKPTVEDLAEAKKVHVNKNEIFGVSKKQNNSIGHKMTEWAINETIRLTPSKK